MFQLQLLVLITALVQMPSVDLAAQTARLTCFPLALQGSAKGRVAELVQQDVGNVWFMMQGMSL